jgi:hypothetical protein
MLKIIGLEEISQIGTGTGRQLLPQCGAQGGRIRHTCAFFVPQHWNLQGDLPM